MKLFTIIGFSFAYIICFGQQYSKSWKDLNFVGGEEDYHRMDIYLPKIENKTR